MGKPPVATRPNVSLRNIAEELQVSVSLVSKVLSGRLGTSGANEAKIKAIHDKARELNYRKNLLAEALRTGRQNTLAVYVHRHGEPSSGIVEELIAGIAEEATRLDQRLIIHYYQTSEGFRTFLPRVHRSAVDGVIVAGLPHRELVADLQELHEQGIAVVTVHDRELDPLLPNVGTDQHEVTRQATLHLIDAGCVRLAHFRVRQNADVTQLPELRYQGFVSALEERGIPLNPELVPDAADFSHVSGTASTRKLLEQNIAFDGIVCQSDAQAMGAVNTLVLAGRRIPQEIKVIGVDDSPFCPLAIVPLSTVSQEFRDRGCRAVRMLSRTLQGQVVRSANVSPVVKARGSTIEPEQI